MIVYAKVFVPLAPRFYMEFACYSKIIECDGFSRVIYDISGNPKPPATIEWE